MLGVRTNQQTNAAVKAVVGGGQRAFVRVLKLEAVKGGAVLEEPFVLKRVVPVLFPDGQDAEEIAGMLDSPLVLSGAFAGEKNACQPHSRQCCHIDNFAAEAADVFLVGQDNQNNSRQKSQMQFNVCFEKKRSEDGDKNPAQCPAGRNQKIVRSQKTGMRPQGIKFTVADHTAAEEQKSIKPDNKGYIWIFFLYKSGKNDAEDAEDE